MRGIDARAHPMPFAKKQRIVQRHAQPRQRVAQRGGTHRQLIGGETNGTVAIDGIKNKQQIEIEASERRMHNIHHWVISLHLILLTIPPMLSVINIINV